MQRRDNNNEVGKVLFFKKFGQKQLRLFENLEDLAGAIKKYLPYDPVESIQRCIFSYTLKAAAPGSKPVSVRYMKAFERAVSERLRSRGESFKHGERAITFLYRAIRRTNERHDKFKETLGKASTKKSLQNEPVLFPMVYCPPVSLRPSQPKRSPALQAEMAKTALEILSPLRGACNIEDKDLFRELISKDPALGLQVTRNDMVWFGLKEGVVDAIRSNAAVKLAFIYTLFDGHKKVSGKIRKEMKRAAISILRYEVYSLHQIYDLNQECAYLANLLNADPRITLEKTAIAMKLHGLGNFHVNKIRNNPAVRLAFAQVLVPGF